MYKCCLFDSILETCIQDIAIDELVRSEIHKNVKRKFFLSRPTVWQIMNIQCKVVEVYARLISQEVIDIEAENKATGTASGSSNLTEISAVVPSNTSTDSSKSVEASSEFLHNILPQPSAPEEPALPPTYEEAISTTTNASSVDAFWKVALKNYELKNFCKD